MNYLLVACILLLLPLNLGWESFYVVKTLGGIFALMSRREICELITLKAQKNGLEKADEKYISLGDKLKKSVWSMAVALFVVMNNKGIFVIVGISREKDNIVSCILGTFSTIIALSLFDKLLDFSKNFGRSVDASLEEGFSPFYAKSEKAGRTFLKFKIIAAIGLAGDVINRLIPVKSVQVGAGVAVAVCRIVMYFILIVLVVNVNILRKEVDSEIS